MDAVSAHTSLRAMLGWWGGVEGMWAKEEGSPGRREERRGEDTTSSTTQHFLQPCGSGGAGGCALQ
jgi:hypothetical protein